MFNFISNQVVYAMPTVLVGYGLIAFAAALTAYGVTVTNNEHVKLLYQKFQEWMDETGTTEYMQNAYYQNKAMITSTAIGVAALGLGLNTWIRTQFEKGYNIKEITLKTDGLYINEGQNYSNSSYEIKNISLVKGQKFYYKFLDINIEFVIKDVLSSSVLVDCYLNGLYIDRVTSVRKYNNTYDIKITTNDDIDNVYVKFYGKDNSGIYTLHTNQQIKKPIIPLPLEIPVNKLNINYYAGEAVDYPMDRNPQDRDINLPPPSLGTPNTGITDAGIVYNGTPEQFLDQMADNQDYINKAVDSVLDTTKAVAQPIVDTAAGTITWTNTGSIDYPLNPPIVNPPITVPETAEQGIGATNSILTGISEYVGNIFAAPTKTIDFNPLMQIALIDRFPFCLPFDLRDIIQKFQADRKAPEFEIAWKVRDTEVKYKMEFAQFERLAEITRWGTFLIFVVGLIMVSRKLIGGE